MDEQEQQLSKKERRALRREQRVQQQQGTSQKRVVTKIIIWTAVVLATGGIIFGLAQKISNTGRNGNSDTDINLEADAISPTDWTKGNEESEVTLIEYGDFQCPACAVFYSVVKQIEEELGDQIYIAYRHFPLRRVHRNAQAAAIASEAAGAQGKFWEMHDFLFENQDEWSNLRDTDDFFTSFAESIGLNTEQFSQDINSKEIENKIQNDFESGVKSGVNSTPSFFLNGKKIQNPASYNEFKELILQEVEKHAEIDQ